MPNEIKSLVASAQDVIARHLDLLDDVGRTPYVLLREALCRATPQQLERIERANPHLIPESNELWFPHCLSFSDLREAYNDDAYPESTDWRQLYQKRVQENERRRQLARAKMRKEYNKIENEKAARSIKVLSGVMPAHGRKTATYEAAKRATTSKLFRETRKAAERTRAIYKCKPSNFPASAAARPSTGVSLQTTSHPRPGSVLSRVYHSLYEQQHVPPRSPPYHPLIQPPSRIIPAKTAPSSTPEITAPSKKPRLADSSKITKPNPRPSPSIARPHTKRSQSEPANNHTTTKRPTAIVNFDIFKQLS